MLLLIELNCGPLSDPLNGQVDVSSTSVGSLATYQCNIGYILVGVTQRICRPNGQWSNSEPICASKHLKNMKITCKCKYNIYMYFVCIIYICMVDFKIIATELSISKL